VVSTAELLATRPALTPRLQPHRGRTFTSDEGDARALLLLARRPSAGRSFCMATASSGWSAWWCY
jgi:hypothetical protein